MTRIYLSGPITGDPDARDKFTDAARRWGAEGEIVNPFEINPSHDEPCRPGYAPGEDGHTSACHMRADIEALLTCDQIVMLHGWASSRGATTEIAVARDIGLTVTYDTESEDDE